MITAYHRPRTIDEALKLIGRTSPRTLPLGGGTLLSHLQADGFEVVDLQALGLNRIRLQGHQLEIGATVTLQQLLEDKHLPPSLRPVLKLEAPRNLRESATVAGSLVACDGRSTLAVALLAMDAKLTLKPEDQEVLIGNLLPLRERMLTGRLVTQVSIPLNVKFAFEQVARTPADKPIVCAGLASWPSGRTRLALGGFGSAPRLAMDGTEAEGLETAARQAFQEASDEWASSEYRMEIAAQLAKRCLATLSNP